MPKSAGGIEEHASLGKRDRINSRICDLPFVAVGPYKTKHIGVESLVAIPVILTPNIYCITLINCPLTISSKPEKQPLINFFK